jgi:Grap2 and cyclin-D-interacting
MPTASSSKKSQSKGSAGSACGASAADANVDPTSIEKVDNAVVLTALHKLTEHIKHDPACVNDPPHLSHYRQPLPSDVQTAYDLLHQGAQLVHSTSTKYTLIGKTHPEEQVKSLPRDLLRGCELIGAASHILFQNPSGCSRAVRRATQRASLGILINVSHLVSVFEDGSAVGGGSANTIGAQKTGAVWESCDQILNKLMPQGNRNAIRREILTWTRECQDSMDEFQEMIDLGSKLGTLKEEIEDDTEESAEKDQRNTDDANDDDDNDDDDFFGDDDDDDNRYSDMEMPIAQACLGLLKNSRGNMKIALETCEYLGTKASETVDDEKRRYLDAIKQVHNHARVVGEGLTDLGSLMYPPLLPSCTDLVSQVRRQSKCIQDFQSYLLDDPDGLSLPNNITEFSNILKNACETRESEAMDAMRIAGGVITDTWNNINGSP